MFQALQQLHMLAVQQQQQQQHQHQQQQHQHQLQQQHHQQQQQQQHQQQQSQQHRQVVANSPQQAASKAASSSPLSFTPTAVMRKMTAEKDKVKASASLVGCEFQYFNIQLLNFI
jgi:Nucleocytoplasmic shuttling protein for mRNA cap-binding EIF4E